MCVGTSIRVLPTCISLDFLKRDLEQPKGVSSGEEAACSTRDLLRGGKMDKAVVGVKGREREGCREGRGWGGGEDFVDVGWEGVGWRHFG